MRWRYVARLMLFMVFAAILIGQPALSRPEYMKNFKGYPDEIKKCTLCHVQSSGYGGLNSFGMDYVMEKRVTKRLLDMDSDGDGYTNGVELNSATFPGNPDSYPGKKAPGFTIVFAIAVLVAIAFARKA